MAKVLAGEAAVRIVPTLRGFHNRVDTELKRKAHSLEVTLDPKFTRAEAEMAAWRRRQEADAVNVPVRADLQTFRRDLSQVEHIFKRNSLARAIRLNIAVIGLDALPALAYAAGSAASGLDALGKSAFAIPGLLGGALASVGALAVGMQGLGDAFKAYENDSKNAADNAKKARDADRDLLRAKRDLSNAIRDQRREIQDLNAEMRRASLNEADAILNVQEAVDRLREGGFKSVTEFQRAQLNVLSSIDHLNQVRTQTSRTAEDVAKANAEGVAQSDRVVDALDRIADAQEKLDESKVTEVSQALAKLHPNAAATVEAIHNLSEAWTGLQQQVSGELFQDLDAVVTELGRKGLPTLQNGLTRVATGLNSNIKAIAGSLGGDKNLSFMDRIFGNTEGGLENLSRGMDPLITGFMRLTEVSSRFLPRLGDAATRVFNRFDAWTEKISADGSMERWVDQGLDALSSLGRAAGNILSIVSSIGEAFNAATGTQGGFIGSLDRATGRLADFLKSAEGQNSLVSYFQRARDFVNQLIEALRPIKNIIGDAVEIAREWSTIVFGVAGAFADMASWIERNTGLLKPLLMAFLTIRTFRPVIEGLTGAWKNYTKVVQAASSFGPTATVFGPAAKGLEQFKSQLSAVTGVARGASSPIKLSADAIKSVNTQAFAALKPANDLTKRFGELGTAAASAGGKVGGTGVGGLGASLRGLGAFIAPTAIFTGAVIGLTALVNKLGEAHAKAAQDADRQKASLDALKGSLDNVTGATTMQTLNQSARDIQNYAIPGLGDRNVASDISRLNLPGVTPQSVLASTIPTQQATRDDNLAKLDEATKQKIAASESWRRFGSLWQEKGIDLDTLAKAANGDPESKSRVDAAMQQFYDSRNIPTAAPDAVKQPLIAAQRAAGNIPDDLTGLVKDSGAYDSVSAAAFIRDRSQAAVDEGNLIRGASDLAYGRGALNDSGRGVLGPDGAVTIDPNGNAIVQTSIQPNIPPELGQVVKTPSGWQVQLTEQGTAQYVQKFATGGLVRGKGTGTSDSNLAALSKGEFVTRQKAVDHYGQQFFDDLNNMRLPKFNTGGFIGPRPIPIPKPAPLFAGQTIPSGPVAGPVSVAPGPAVSGPRAGGNPLGSITGGYRPPPTQGPLPALFPTGGAGGSPLRAITAGRPTPGVSEYFNRMTPKVSAPPAKGTFYSDWYKKPAPPKPATRPVSPSGAPTHLTGSAPGPHHTTPAGMPRLPGPVTPIAPPALATPYGVSSGSTAAFGNLPTRLGGEQGLQINTIRTKRAIEALFPQITSIGGYREDSLQWHPNGLAIDVMIPGAGGLNDPTPPEGKALGDQIYQYLMANKEAFGIDYIMWQEKDHFNHLHVNTTGGGYPTGAEQFGLPDMSAGLPPGLQLSIPQILGQAGAPSSGPGGFDFGARLQQMFEETYKPENIMNFLSGTAQNVGSQLTGIGVGFLSGITGIDLSGPLGIASQVGNHFLSGDSGSSSSGSGAALNDEAQANIDAYINGGLPSSLSPDVLSSLGIDTSQLGLTGAAGGAEKWRPVVRKILEQVAPQYGITNIKAWEDALVKQIDTESGGNANVGKNLWDSNAAKGTPSEGLLQFVPSTFAAHNISGGAYTDPVAQIYAAIDYVASKYGMDATGAPKQIGRGVGYKTGGLIKGKGGNDAIMARISRGEFLNNAQSVKHYGPGLFAALNSMAIPKENLPGFNTGAQWLPQQPLPTPPPNVPPPPPLAPPGQQTPGPLNLQTAAGAAQAGFAASAPSTGGGPGPGATAPAPEPSPLPQVGDALAGIGGIGAAGGEASGLAQPGASPSNAGDNRGVLGAAPVSQEHNNPALKAGIEGAWNVVGSIAGQAAGMAASAAIGAGSMGAAAPAAGPAGAAASSLASGGFQIAGKVASGAVNILSSLLVGTLTGGSTAQASGVPLLPQRQPMQTGVPAVQNDNRQYHLTNLDAYQALQERQLAQQTQPFIGKF